METTTRIRLGYGFFCEVGMYSQDQFIYSPLKCETYMRFESGAEVAIDIRH